MDIDNIECWGPQGSARYSFGAGCPQEAKFIGNFETEFAASGWGFTLDPNTPNADAFYACPDCKDNDR